MLQNIIVQHTLLLDYIKPFVEEVSYKVAEGVTGGNLEGNKFANSFFYQVPDNSEEAIEYSNPLENAKRGIRGMKIIKSLPTMEDLIFVEDNDFPIENNQIAGWGERVGRGNYSVYLGLFPEDEYDGNRELYTILDRDYGGFDLVIEDNCLKMYLSEMPDEFSDLSVEELRSICLFSIHLGTDFNLWDVLQKVEEDSKKLP